MRKIAVINAKGGQAKTTTSANLAAGLADKGKSVLVLDLDPQGHISRMFGVPVSGHPTMTELLVEQAELDKCIVTLRNNLNAILSDLRLERAVRILTGANYRETVLRRLLTPLEGQIDYVICDCAPGFNLINQNALMYVDEVFVPVSMEFLALCGLNDLQGQLKEARQITKHDIRIRHIIPTFYDRRNKRSDEILDLLKEQYGESVTSPIRINSRLSEAAGVGQTIFEYAPKSPGAIDYRKLVVEVLRDEEATD